MQNSRSNSTLYRHKAHWADQTAERIIAERGAKERYVCASGITPSGTVHIGNFREIISVDLVHRALQDRGQESRFIYSWDNFDVFRKVPKNIPPNFEEYLRLPIVDIPDPIGSSESYAKHFEGEIERVLPKLGVFPEYLYQTPKYRSGLYAEGIRQALAHREAIRRILNTYRENELGADWWPVTIFSRFTGRDTTKILSWDGEWTLRYICLETEKEDSIDIREPVDKPVEKPVKVGGDKPVDKPLERGGLKLFWRIDWPMRWKFEGVDFEPAGKEHHSAGGSFDTARAIAQEVYDQNAPVSFKYDFVSVKGKGGKISSSLGNALSVDDVLAVYQPEVLRYLFAGTRPNAEFAMSFDLDVIKIYEDYDRCERIFYGLENVNEKRRIKDGRIYELSQIARPKAGEASGHGTSAPTGEEGEQQHQTGAKPELLQFPFRHLCNCLLVYNGNVSAALLSIQGAKQYFERHPERLASAEFRARCAWNWLQKHAPAEFRFRCRRGDESPLPLSEAELNALRQLRAQVQAGVLDGAGVSEAASSAGADTSTTENTAPATGMGEKALQNLLYDIARSAELEPKEFFRTLYSVLIEREQGPRLASFLKILGTERVLKILEPYM